MPHAHTISFRAKSHAIATAAPLARGDEMMMKPAPRPSILQHQVLPAASMPLIRARHLFFPRQCPSAFDGRRSKFSRQR